MQGQFLRNLRSKRAVNILDLSYLEEVENQTTSIVGGIYASADSYTTAGYGGGAALSGAYASGQKTSTSTNTSVKTYNSGTSSVTDSYGGAYAYANTGNSTSRAYDNSLSFSAYN